MHLHHPTTGSKHVHDQPDPMTPLARDHGVPSGRLPTGLHVDWASAFLGLDISQHTPHSAITGPTSFFYFIYYLLIISFFTKITSKLFFH